VVKGPGRPPESNPGDAPSGRDAHELYEMGSIRHVMLEIGKLTSKVDRLIDDVKDNSDSISSLKVKLSKFETTAKVTAAVVAVVAFVFWWALGDRVKNIVDEAFKSAYSSSPTTSLPSPTPIPKGTSTP